MPVFTPPCPQQHVETSLTFLLHSKSLVFVSCHLVCAAHVSYPLARGKQAAKALLEGGADPKLYSLKGMTPLIHAVDEGPACERGLLRREGDNSLCLLLPVLLYTEHAFRSCRPCPPSPTFSTSTSSYSYSYSCFYSYPCQPFSLSLSLVIGPYEPHRRLPRRADGVAGGAGRQPRRV